MRRRRARLYIGQGARDGTHMHTPTPLQVCAVVSRCE